MKESRNHCYRALQGVTFSWVRGRRKPLTRVSLSLSPSPFVCMPLCLSISLSLYVFLLPSFFLYRFSSREPSAGDVNYLARNLATICLPLTSLTFLCAMQGRLHWGGQSIGRLQCHSTGVGNPVGDYSWVCNPLGNPANNSLKACHGLLPHSNPVVIQHSLYEKLHARMQFSI